MKSNNNFLGKRIQELRKCKKITQPILAEMISVDPKYISKLETGTSNPSLETLQNIAKALDVEISTLFDYSHLNDNEVLIEKIIYNLKHTNSKNVKLIYNISNLVINTY